MKKDAVVSVTAVLLPELSRARVHGKNNTVSSAAVLWSLSSLESWFGWKLIKLSGKDRDLFQTNPPNHFVAMMRIKDD